MTNKIKNEDRAKADNRYAHKLLTFAKEGGEFKDEAGNNVSASACIRQINGTPLNHNESKFFDLDEEYRNEFMNCVFAEIEELMLAGKKEYSLHAIVGGIRYNADKQGDGDTFKINDHWVPVAARIANERIDELGFGFTLHFRGMKGEVLPKKSQDELDTLPAFFGYFRISQR